MPTSFATQTPRKLTARVSPTTDLTGGEASSLATPVVMRPQDAHQTLANVTVRIDEVVLTEDQLLLTFSVNAGPYFSGAQVDIFPAHVELGGVTLQADDIVLTEMERKALFAPLSSRGRATYELRTSPPPPGTRSLTLAIDAATLTAVPAKDLLRFGLEGRNLGDDWPLDQRLGFGPVDLVLERARLLEAESRAYSYRLEFVYQLTGDQEGDGIVSLSCPRIYRIIRGNLDASQAWCREGEPVTVTEFGAAQALNLPLATQPFDYFAVADIYIRGFWRITWTLPVDR